MNREQLQQMAGELMKILTDLEEIDKRYLALKRRATKAYFAVDDALDLESFRQNPNLRKTDEDNR